MRIRNVMAHAHSHDHNTPERRLALSLVLTALFVVAEGGAGFVANSLALLSDAAHNLADALALGFSWFAIRYSKRPADQSATFGYHRGGILAALVNAVSLVVVALFILWEAVRRLAAPEPVAGWLMTGVAAVAFLLNGTISLWLQKEARGDLNVRSAYLHMLGDALSAACVIVAGLFVTTTGATFIDPAVSILIGGLILWSSWSILADTVNVLLEATPRGLDMEKLGAAVKAEPGVLDVHDLHVWTVASGIVACSCHLVVAEQSVGDSREVRCRVQDLLRDEFHMTHITIQVELAGCESEELFCTLRKDEHGSEHHELAPIR